MSAILDASNSQAGLLARLRAKGKSNALLSGAIQVLSIRLAGAALSYGSMILLARWLGAFEFGIYAYI